MKRTTYIAAALLAAGSTLAGAVVPKQWAVIQKGKGGTYEFKPDGDGFMLNLKRLPGKERAAAVVFANINTQMPSQDKLLFSCRGLNGNPVRLTLILSYRDGQTTKAPFGPAFSVSGTGWKHHTISLDRDFKLGDALFDIRQLKFVANITTAPAGTECGIEIKDVRFSSPDEAGFSGGRADIIVHPKEVRREQADSNALNVYFHLDNEDYNRVFRNRRQTKPLPDNNQYAGFREMLLDSVRKQAVPAESPDKADVIVYSSTLPNPEIAAAIVRAVRERGTPLFAASEIADPEIAALLPVSIKKTAQKGFPDRKQLDAAGTALLPEGKTWNSAAFGIHHRLKPRNAETILLKFSDGSPAVVEGRAGKGRVVYSTFSLGANLIPDSAAHDRFFLQMLSSLTGRTLTPAPAPQTVAKDGWLPGAGEENFGRFGIRLGDGLLTETVTNTLTAGKGALEYSFDSKQKQHLLLQTWKYRPLTGKAGKTINWDWKWPVIGKVELTAEYPVPVKWKGQNICFLAEGGIDDLAEVYFNGVLLGKVTQDMPHYWDRPHRYRIAPELIRFGEPNTIRILSENLRGSGGFGKCPELIVQDGNSVAQHLAVDRASWLGKGGVLSDGSGTLRRFDTSLAFPGIRWEIFTPEISLALSNIADYAAYRKNGRIRIVDLRKTESVDPAWDEPWLLLFRDAEEFPLLLVFSRKMTAVVPSETGNQFNGFSLRRAPEIGMITPVWITGSERVDSRGWKNGLPDTIVRSIEYWYPKAFQYPVECREFFKIDGGRIAIKTSYTYRTAESDWEVKTAPFAPISPLAWQMRGTLTETENVRGTGLITSIGEFALAENTDTARWSLPLPAEASTAQIPAVLTESDITETANRLFDEGRRWSAGGRTPFRAWTPQYPMGRKLPECSNLSFHAWAMGLNQLLNAPFQLTPENRENFAERIRIRFLEPVERFQYKAANRWREEPFSGIRYPIYFNSFYPHSTRYAEGTGTALDYGDQNETAFMILSIAQQLADKHGQKEFVLANWNFLKQAARLPLVSDDWGYMACHCRESGAGATIDMLNCEYAGMLKLARLAEIAGDSALRSQALYRAARRMVPTLARLTFLQFAGKHKLEAYPENLLFSVGFKEDGAAYRAKGSAPKDIDLYDMSQGTPEELVELYRTYAPEAVKPYLNSVRNDLLNAPNAKKSSLADILARTGAATPEQMREILTAILNDEPSMKRLGTDWPGITFPAYVNSILARIHSAPKITVSRLLKLNDVVYNPADGTLRIDADAIPESRLALEVRKTDTVAVNGENVTPDRSGFVPLAPGRNSIVLTRKR